MFGTDNQYFQPVQLYHLANDGICCDLIPADESLRGDIHYYWKLSITADEVLLPVIPDGALDLVLSPDIADFAAIYCPQTTPFDIALHGPVVYVGICFRAARATRWFAHGLAQLAALEAGAGVVETLRLQALVSAIQGHPTNGQLASILDDFLQSYSPPIDRAHINIMAKTLDLLEAGSISTLAAQVGLSERQLRRVTRDLTGLTPKQIHRIVRMQQALRELLQPDSPLPSTDYYDDSHRIRELRSLTGLTPGEIRRMAEKYNQSD